MQAMDDAETPMMGPLPESGGATSEPNGLRRWLVPLIGALLFVASVWVLHRELRAVRYREVSLALRSLPPGRNAGGPRRPTTSREEACCWSP